MMSTLVALAAILRACLTFQACLNAARLSIAWPFLERLSGSDLNKSLRWDFLIKLREECSFHNRGAGDPWSAHHFPNAFWALPWRVYARVRCCTL